MFLYAMHNPVKSGDSIIADLLVQKEEAMKVIDGIALTAVIIGAINWGLIGFFNFNLVDSIFGTMSIMSRIIYALVGICGLYAIKLFMRLGNE